MKSTTYVADLTKLKTDNKHTGNHNRRYFFTIKVINTAQLVAIEHIDILVDESPPETGSFNFVKSATYVVLEQFPIIGQ
jgi:hypothetical protein